MQTHEEYRQNQAALGAYPSSYHVLLNAHNSTHDISKSMPAATSGMYAPNTAAIPGPAPQHHQSGQPPSASMVQQQQMNHRPMMINNLQTRPNTPMPSMSRNPMGGVSQPAPQGHQQYSHVQNVMLQSHNMHPPSMQTPHAPMMIAAQPLTYFQAARPLQYQQQYYVQQCFPYQSLQPNTTPAYYQMPAMQSCPPAVNSVPESVPQQSARKKYLSIINPKTGEDVLSDLLNNTTSETREPARSGGSDVAVKFASQVAAVVALKDSPTVHHMNEDMEDSQPAITNPEDVSISESARDSISNEMSTPEICDQLEDEEEILSSRESPGISFPSKNRINSISGNSPLPLDSECDLEDISAPEVVEVTHPLINHEEPESTDAVAVMDATVTVMDSVRDSVILRADETNEVVEDIGNTNCVLEVEKEEVPVPIDDFPSIQPPQPEISETTILAQAGDTTMSNKSSEEVSNSLKTEKAQEGRKGKKNKKKELNKKGESKEGSEMDAFYVAGDVREQDSTPTPASTPEVVASPTSVPPAALVSALTPPLIQSPSPTVGTVLEPTGETDNDTTALNTIPPSDEVVLDERPAGVEAPEEIVPSNDAAEKKEAAEPGLVADTPKITLKYEYKEDQWSPLNPEGKKQYDREFLLKLQSQPMSLQKPLNLPNLDVIKDKAQLHKLNDSSRISSVPFPPRGPGQFDPFIPLFVRPGAPKPPHPGARRSQQGREKPKKVIAFSSSLNQSVKLHESENAWKPSLKNQNDTSAEETVLQELYKKVRGILNKLTPQKFDTLLNQVKELDIDNEEKLNGVIDLVFEKAIDEPNFSVPYAMMCKQLAMIKVPSAEREGQSVNFRKLLLTKCQKEFEQDRSDEIQSKEKLKQIQECDQEDKKKALQEEFDEEERKNRRRQLGNIRFIGELFKLGMLIEPIMHECIKKLLSQGDEDSLECLCRLLTTIGREIDSREDKSGSKESNREIMNSYFAEMQKIVVGRKTSSRVRFMLQDVIDLKSRNWIPRRDENNPKTIDQIHQEAQREAHEQQQMLQNMPFPPKRPSDDGRRKSTNTGRSAGSSFPVEDGWISSSRSGKANCSFDASKLKQFSNQQHDVEHMQLGPSRGHMISWGKGSSGGYKPTEAENKSAPIYNSNRYGVLCDSYQNEPRRAPQRSTASSRESSRGRNSQMSSMVRKTPSASKERENLIETVSQMTRGTQPPEPKPVEPAKVPDSVQNMNGKDAPANSSALIVSELSSEEIEKKIRSIMDEFLHTSDFAEAERCVMEIVSKSRMHIFITEAINQILERSSQSRHMFAQLMQRMVKSNALLMEQYNKGLVSILEVLEDYAVDIPKIHEYLGEIIEPMVDSSPESLSQLKEILRPCVPSLSAGKLVSAVLHCAAKTKGNLKIGEMWKQSKLEWSDFLPSDVNIEDFIEREDLGFTVTPVKTTAKLMPFDEMKKKFMSFLSSFDNNENIFDWVEGNIGEDGINKPSFVRALITAVLEDAIIGATESCELCVDKLKPRLPLLLRYVAKKNDLELEALYAVQALMNQLGHPKGVLRAIFDILYDDDIICEETFKKWETFDNPAEQEGKGVAICSVAGFFTWLREADEESEEG